MKQSIRNFELLLSNIRKLVENDSDKEVILSEMGLFANTLNALARYPISSLTIPEIQNTLYRLKMSLSEAKRDSNRLFYIAYLEGQIDTYERILQSLS